MKRLIIYSILSIVAIYSYGQNSFNKTDIKSIMKSVADWQIANPAKGNEHDDLNWTYAALYMGMIDWAELTEKEDKDSSYYEWLMKIGRRNAWQVGKYMYHADHIAVGQVFLDVPEISRPEYVASYTGTYRICDQSSVSQYTGTGLQEYGKPGTLVMVRCFIHGTSCLC